MNNENTKQESSDDIEKKGPVERGEEAIKIQRQIFDKNKSKVQQEKDERKDAEKWHNEG